MICQKLTNRTKLSALFALILSFTASVLSRSDKQTCCMVNDQILKKHQYIRDMSHKFLIIIGASKSGSTLMFNLMDVHPQTSGPIARRGIFRLTSKNKRGMRLKEMHFFDRVNQDFENYISSFNLTDLELGKTLIEGTPSYMLHTASACLIKQYLPNAKFVVILKEPSERALSHCKMGGSLKGFYTKATQQMQEFKNMKCDLVNKGWTDCYGCHEFRRNLITRGLYGPQLKNWLQFFQPDQFLIVNHNETYDQQKTADKVFKFAGLEPYKLDQTEGISGFMGKKMEYSDDVKLALNLLRDFFKPFNEYFYDLLRNEFQVYDFSFE